jgi:ketosteroid isomerase-like protein
MSEENIDILRRWFEATNRRDFAAVLDAYAEDVVLVVDESVLPTNGGTFCGREDVGDWFADWFRSFAEYQFDIEEALSVDERVFMVVHHHGRGRASGVALDWSLAYAFTIRGGKIARMELYPSRAEALAAVGLAE